MIENDIYFRRFREKAYSLGINEMPDDATIEKYRTDGISPKVAASKHFGKLKLKSRVSSEELEEIVISACQAFGLKPTDVATGDSKEMRDLKTIVCFIAINEKNLRPHTVIRKRLGLKYNSMVNHYSDRFQMSMNRVGFLEKVEITRKGLSLQEIKNSVPNGQETFEVTVPFGVIHVDDNSIQDKIEKKFSIEFKDSTILNAQSLMTLGLVTERYVGQSKAHIGYSIFLYGKLIEHHQTIQVLLKRGAITSARVLVRAMIECQLNIMSIINKPELFQDIQDFALSEKRKQLTHLLEIDKKFDIVKWSSLGFTEADLNIPTANKKLGIQHELCNAAYPSDSYREMGWYFLYRLFSIDAHSTNDSLNNYEWNNNGNFEVSLQSLVETIKVADASLLETKDNILEKLLK